MSNRLPSDITATGADEKLAAGAAAQVVRHLIVVLLLTAAALDLTRCGLVMTAARHPAPAAGLVAAGLAAAALTARTARGCQAGQRWASWTALLIGAASTPQAAESGFRCPYTIPDIATAALGAGAGHHHPGDRGRDGPLARDTENLLMLDRGATGTTRRLASLARPSLERAVGGGCADGRAATRCRGPRRSPRVTRRNGRRSSARNLTPHGTGKPAAPARPADSIFFPDPGQAPKQADRSSCSKRCDRLW
jgi:hypothetical protein